jgi:hypothetical protein
MPFCPFFGPPMCFLDTPEIAPGAFIGHPNSSVTTGIGGATVAASSPAPTQFSDISATSSSTSSPQPSQSGSSSNAGAIAGGIVGGVAVISIAAAIIFYLRSRRSTAPSTSMLQPPVEEGQQPLSQGAAFSSTSNSQPVSASVPESPVTSMRLYVRTFRPRCGYALLNNLLSGTFRTRTIRPRTLGINPKTMRAWSRCIQRSHKHTDIMVYPPLDFGFGITESSCNLLRSSFSYCNFPSMCASWLVSGRSTSESSYSGMPRTASHLRSR